MYLRGVLVHGASESVDVKVAEQLRELERIAGEAGVRVSYEPMAGLVSGAGGICRVRGEYRVIIDRRVKPSDRVNMLLDALRRFDTQAIEMPDVLRRALSGGKSREAEAPRRSA